MWIACWLLCYFTIRALPPLPFLTVTPPSPPPLPRALACWDCRPSPTWLAAYFTASHPRLCEARPAHISCQLSALAKLGLTAPGPWLDEALGSFCAQLPEAKAHDLVRLEGGGRSRGRGRQGEGRGKGRSEAGGRGGWGDGASLAGEV